MSSNYEIRAKARETLGGGIFKNEWVYPVVIMVILSAISGALSATGVGLLIAEGVLMIAVSNYFIGRVRGTEPHDRFGALLDGAKKDLAGGVVAGILHTLFIALWTILFIIPGIVKSCSYALTYYIKNDRPELSATEAITESRRMMDGFKMKYFMLQLSFIGWIIVGILTLGIGMLWVSAYMEAATAHFYEEVRAEKATFLSVLPSDNPV